MDALLADLIALTHFLFIAFVVIGLLLIVAGLLLGWQWVRNPWFRAIHLASVVYVAVQAWLGVDCPLTVWEADLRESAGQDFHRPGGFVADWVHRIIFYRGDPMVFTIAYTVFGLLVIGTFLFGPPRFRRPVRPA